MLTRMNGYKHYQVCRFEGITKTVVGGAEKGEREAAELVKKVEEYQDYAKRIHILEAEMDRLVAINKGMEEDNKAMRLKYSSIINWEKRSMV
ncbi:unnamed protein product [Sphagnum balticum]